MARSAQTLRPETCRIEIHADGRIRRMDRAALALWGLEDAPDRVQELWHDGDATILVPEDPVRAKMGDGSARPVKVKILAHGDGVSLVVRDAGPSNEQLHAEEQRAKAEALSGIGTWEWDIKNDDITWSQQLYNHFGLDPETFEATYEAFMERIHPDDAKMVNATVEQAFQDHQPWSFEHRIKQANGNVLWVLGQGAVDVEDGEPVRMYGTEQDITERKLFAERDRIRKAWFDQSVELLCVTDSTGKFVELNPSWERTLGWRLDEMIGRPFMDFVHPEDVESSRAEAARLWDMRGHETDGFENRYRAKDGSYKHLHWTSGVDKETGNLYAVARDMTAQQEAEEAKRRAYEQQHEIKQLEKSNQARIQLLNSVAHELNTPLTPIQLQLRVLQRNLEQEVPVPGRTMQIIRRNLDRLAALVKDILDAARMESGRLRLRPAACDMAAVAKDAIQSFEDLAAKENVQLDLRVDGDGRLTGDADRLTQVFFNLISNAIKFAPADGVVHVHVQGEADRIQVSVDDDGEGFAADRAARLFQPFSQIHDSTGHGGTGLGLYICKGIIEEHGGQIRAISPGPGLGASFRFWVPRIEPGPEGA